MKPSIIIFDLMDTIVVDPFYTLFPKYFNMPLKELYKIKNPNIWPLFEIGKVTEEEYFQQFFLPNSGHQLENTENLKEAVFAAYSYIDEMEELLAELKDLNFKLWIHSNYSLWFEEVRKRLSLDRFFQGYSVSYKTTLRKPDPAAYQVTLSMIGLEAKNCIFIDDRVENVSAAEAVGLNAIQFISVKELKIDLKQYINS